MKSAFPFLGLTLLMAVSACDSKKQDAVENAYENKAAAIDNMADNLQNKADNVSAAVGDGVLDAQLQLAARDPQRPRDEPLLVLVALADVDEHLGRLRRNLVHLGLFDAGLYLG